MTNSLGVVSFLPDRGHIQPLLRLASLVGAVNRLQVTCWLPVQYVSLAREFGFEVHALEIKVPTQVPSVIQEIAEKSTFYNAYSGAFEMRTAYWVPLREAASFELEKVLTGITRLNPAVVISDHHLFQDYYAAIAAICGASLVVCQASGTPPGAVSEVVEEFGYRDGSKWTYAVVGGAGRFARYWFRIWRILRNSSARRRNASVLASASKRANNVFRKYSSSRVHQTVYTYAGVAVLERLKDPRPQMAGQAFDLVLPGLNVKGPRSPVDSTLEQWLNKARCRPLVYVSFGTMFRPRGEIFDHVLRGLFAASVDVLWSMPGLQTLALPDQVKKNGAFYFAESVPQAEVLLRKNVDCFISHGGTGGVMEAAVAAKPILCIPLLWDQPFNSSVVERCGIGIVLSKRRLSARKVSSAVTRIINDPKYATAAREVADSLSDPIRSAAAHEWARNVYSDAVRSRGASVASFKA